MKNAQTLLLGLLGVVVNTKLEKLWLEEDMYPNFDPEKLGQLSLQNFFKFFEAGKISVLDFFRTLKEIAIKEDITDEEIRACWNKFLTDIPADRMKLLHRLKDKYQLILVSNTDILRHEAVTAYSLQNFGENIFDCFDACFFSHELGMRKPNTDIYKIVIDELHLNPSGCLFFDSRMENLAEAGKMGMPALLVKEDIDKLLKDY